MRKHIAVTTNLIIVLQVLMLIFSFVDLSSLPGWIRYGGKFHPVLLHLPIAMLLLLVPITLLKKNTEQDSPLNQSIQLLLIYNALIASVTAIGGLLLAAGESYDPQTLSWHKWMGIAVAVASHGLVYLNKYTAPSTLIWRSSLAVSVIALVIGSHFGGTLTHGEGYLSFAEEAKEIAKVPEFTEKTTVFDGAIQPVITAKCVSCHNDKKAKGGLNLTALQHMLKGGESGALWVAGDPDKSLMIERMLLDMDDKKHMPPKGKAQLSSNEIMLFKEWVKAGADVKKTYHALADTDSLKKIVTNFIAASTPKKKAKEYKFEAASASAIAALNSPFRRILPLATNSPALSVKFYLKEKFDLNMLKECKSIGKQIVEVNLSTMPAGDDVIPVLNSFDNLETINLNGTSITGKTLDQLSSNKTLEEISLVNTQVDVNAVRSLTKASNLKRVYLWNTRVNATDIAALKKESSKINWDMGYVPDKNELLKLTPPYLADKEKTIIERGEAIALKHPLPGVKIRYTLDGTTPDTTAGKAYAGPFIPETGLVRVIAVATRDGWVSSNLSDNTFFLKGLKCDSAKLVNPTHNRYKSLGSISLIDLKKGYAENQDNLYSNWLGFRENSFKGGFYFSGSQDINEIVLSTADMTRGYVLPPQKVIIKAGDAPDQLKTVGQITPEQPTAYRGNANIPYSIKITPGKYRYIEIEAIPIGKLPQWHDGKGDKAWVFVDEVFFY